MTTRIISCAAAALAVAGIITTHTSAPQRGRGAAAPAARQILDGMGHISVRSDRRPDRFFLSRDLAPALVTAADLVEYDLDGNSMETPMRQGYQERFIHALIYKARPDVMSVVHSHTPSILPFADSSVPLRPMYHMASFLLPGVPTFEIRRVNRAVGMLVNSIATGSALANTLGDKAVALLRGHGAVIVGPNIPETVSRAIFLDINARAQLQAITLGGTVTYFSQEDVEAPVGGRGEAAPAPRPATPVVTTYPRSWPFLKERAMGK